MQGESLTAENWVDERDLLMLSTFHLPRLVDSGKRDHKTREIILKPESVVDCNENMGLVDKSDMQMSFNDSALILPSGTRSYIFTFET